MSRNLDVFYRAAAAERDRRDSERAADLAREQAEKDQIARDTAAFKPFAEFINALRDLDVRVYADSFRSRITQLNRPDSKSWSVTICGGRYDYYIHSGEFRNYHPTGRATHVTV